MAAAKERKYAVVVLQFRAMRHDAQRLAEQFAWGAAQVRGPVTIGDEELLRVEHLFTLTAERLKPPAGRVGRTGARARRPPLPAYGTPISSNAWVLSLKVTTRVT